MTTDAQLRDKLVKYTGTTVVSIVRLTVRRLSRNKSVQGVLKDYQLSLLAKAVIRRLVITAIEKIKGGP